MSFFNDCCVIDFFMIVPILSITRLQVSTTTTRGAEKIYVKFNDRYKLA